MDFLRKELADEIRRYRGRWQWYGFGRSKFYMRWCRGVCRLINIVQRHTRPERGR